MAKRLVVIRGKKDVRKAFRRLSEDAEHAVNVVTAEVAVEVLRELAMNTPVDTAQARSNWRVSIGHVLRSFVKPFYPYASRWRKPYGPGGSKGETANTNAVVNLAKMRLARYDGKRPINISNNAPYINRLNKGYSSQSGSGWIQRSKINGLRRLDRRLKKILKKEFG